jgi:hypothetical protein
MGEPRRRLGIVVAVVISSAAEKPSLVVETQLVDLRNRFVGKILANANVRVSEWNECTH